MSYDSGSDANLECGMNLIISNVCLEASSFERECAPKTTLEDWPLAELKNKSKENKSNRLIPKSSSGEKKWWRRSYTYRDKDCLQGHLAGLGV